jgi:hypothetical protein
MPELVRAAPSKDRAASCGLSVPKAEDLERLSRAFGARIEQADGQRWRNKSVVAMPRESQEHLN